MARYLLPLLGLMIALLTVAVIFAGDIFTGGKQEPAPAGANRIAPIDRSTSLADTIKQRPDLSHFYRMLSASGQLKKLESKDKYTVFAPNNQALFFNQGTVERLLASKSQLREVVKFHISKGRIKGLHDRENLISLGGDQLSVNIDGDKKFVQDGLAIDKQQSDNGVVYIIDELLLPPGLDN